ncbi:MATE family efflux transporter [Catenovulum sp. SX2]|uniref:MATE family efflux transporter n=1 Tax=Catenovulum sp. SX2 TaxID=3398614 RepID=UPI003F856976
MQLSPSLTAYLALALPMIVSNITTPLLGIVDTSILGHLPHAYLLAGVALANTIITAVVWLFGFLRMSTTGLTAQALGKQNPQLTSQLLVQGLSIAIVVSLVLLILQPWILQSALWLAEADPQVNQAASEYFFIRFQALPASLINLVLVGWLLAHGKTKAIMLTQIVINLVNVLLDLILVFVFDLAVKGVAWASLAAEYTGLVIYLFIAYRMIVKTHLLKTIQQSLTQMHEINFRQFLAVNRDILIRTLVLECALVFLTFQGARIGVDVLAANALLMNFLLLISLGLDGIAYAAEVQIGKTFGANDKSQLKQNIRVGMNLSLALAAVYSLVFLLFDQQIIGLMTDIDSIKTTALTFSFYIIILPLTAVWCFLLDGVFIGLADSKSMRNSMLVSVVGVFFPVWFVFNQLALTQGINPNHALWIALHAMMLARGITLARKIAAYI